MAYQIIRRDENKYQPGTEITAILDAAADLDSLGTTWSPGSVAIVADVGTDAGSISSTFKTVTISGVTSATFPYSIGRLCGQIKSYPQLFGYLYRNNNTSPATIQLKCINLGSSSSVTLPAGEYELLVYYKK